MGEKAGKGKDLEAIFIELLVEAVKLNQAPSERESNEQGIWPRKIL